MGLMRAHSIELQPNASQSEYFVNACGCARYAYNWGLETWKQMYLDWKEDNTKDKPNEALLRKRLNSIKRQDYPWMLEVTKCAPEQALKNLGTAFKNFFEGRTKYPTKRRKFIHDSFYISNDKFQVDGKKIKIPKLGWVRMREALRFTGKILSATVSKKNGRWFVSINVELDVSSQKPMRTENQSSVGIDLGIKDLVTFSFGKKLSGPKPLKTLIDRVKRLNRSLSKKVKDSSNYKRVKDRLAKLHFRISNIRKDYLHKLTTKITSRFSNIVIEDLHIKGMMKNHCLARSFGDQALGEFRRQLEYKAIEVGSNVIVADRWFPSSKLCSECGFKVKKLPLSIREWRCESCGALHDRDINAAINLEQLAIGLRSGAEAHNAADETKTKSSLTKMGSAVSKKQ